MEGSRNYQTRWQAASETPIDRSSVPRSINATSRIIDRRDNSSRVRPVVRSELACIRRQRSPSRGGILYNRRTAVGANSASRPINQVSLDLRPSFRVSERFYRCTAVFERASFIDSNHEETTNIPMRYPLSASGLKVPISPVIRLLEGLKLMALYIDYIDHSLWIQDC